MNSTFGVLPQERPCSVLHHHISFDGQTQVLKTELKLDRTVKQKVLSTCLFLRLVKTLWVSTPPLHVAEKEAVSQNSCYRLKYSMTFYNSQSCSNSHKYFCILFWFLLSHCNCDTGCTACFILLLTSKWKPTEDTESLYHKQWFT